MLHEGATLFLKSAADNLEIQKECTEEQLKSLHVEIKEQKDTNIQL